ncbi:MAG: hypothetical protein QW761_01685 [Candidatus Aenigmatarchaeota archaeon]
MFTKTVGVCLLNRQALEPQVVGRMAERCTTPSELWPALPV